MANVFKYGDITYHDLQSINRQTMANQGVSTDAWLSAAAQTQLIPITSIEFRYVCVAMPIVFSPVGKPMPLAITSFKVGKNIFIEEGQWRKNVYTPLALKRYPFALADTNSDGKRLLCLDATVMSEDNVAPLFDTNGKNSQQLNDAIKLCQEYDKQVSSTEAIIDYIDSIGLFAEKQLTIQDNKGKEHRTGIFKIIDTEKYTALTSDQIAKLHELQGMWLIHTHLISLDRIRAVAKASIN